MNSKFVAFQGPHSGPGAPAWSRPPAFFFPDLRAAGVSDVVRLNDDWTYDAAAFEDNGFVHHHMAFIDCANPPPDVVRRFMAVCAAARGAVAVHCLAGEPPHPAPVFSCLILTFSLLHSVSCLFPRTHLHHLSFAFRVLRLPPPPPNQTHRDPYRALADGSLRVAGLGRTGTLIALWLMAHCGWRAREAIAWLRLVRPGSVIGARSRPARLLRAAEASTHPSCSRENIGRCICKL